jgi:hypothetical protein
MRHASGSTPLREYFRSGWAFLVPYFAVYALYAWLQWPVNAASLTASRPLSSVPCLLHVFWFLHAVHLGLAALAFASWWRNQRGDSGLENTERAGRQSSPPPPFRPAFSALWPLLPWLGLALLFWIPGPYLEWPADPWEHLRRINEWHALDQVTAHSRWMKSSYFLPYSLTGHVTGLTQLSWLNLYYTAICLLLCWQYYRLARSCNLGARAALVFVIIQALLFGNNIFSFYRYYGISSTIYAQLGAVALIRIALDFAAKGASRPRRAGDEFRPTSATSVDRRAPWAGPTLGELGSLGASGCGLGGLIALNHVQGLGIAGIGIGAIAIWRLIEWRRSMTWWLSGGTILINVLFLWLYSRPATVEAYHDQGWLNAWYGFNFFDLASPAVARMLQIVGLVGLAAFIAGFLLLRRNHVVAWLTLTPPIVLLLPMFAIPFAILIGNKDVADIVTFQRMLLAIPFALALVTVGEAILTGSTFPRGLVGATVTVGIPFLLLLLTALSPGANTYSRMWHSLVGIPKDLSLLPIIAAVAEETERSGGSRPIMTTSIPAFIVQVQLPGQSLAWGATARHYALSGRVPVDDGPAIENVARSVFTMQRSSILLFSPDLFTSGYSQAAALSRHWPPQDAILASFGTPEFARFCLGSGLEARPPRAHAILYRSATPVAPPTSK